MARRTPVDWVFDVVPASRARRGGDPAEHAFDHDVATFVREVLQNSNDQALEDAEAAEVVFSFVELSGPKLEWFLEALSFATLGAHLDAASHTRGGRGLEQALEHMRANDRLLVLAVEDRGTIGLVGDEDEGDSNFRALCKDTLYSHKPSEAAGGSFGLGKSVLWRFSGLSTVLFSSNPSRAEPKKDPPRLIGRAELPSHAIDKEWYSGSGWFGARVELERGERAESLWGKQAAALAEKLHLARDGSPGTSVLILGFRDPSAERTMKVPELIADMKLAAARNFWPANVRLSRALRVGFRQGEALEWIEQETFPELRPFMECACVDGPPGVDLRVPGDIAAREIEIEIPPRIDGRHGKVKGRVLLVVRLASDEDAGPLLSSVALYRGPGMITRYWERRNLSIGMRPFHAIVRAGLARSSEPDASDDAVEQFLRAAEPPGHDVWKSTAALKELYKPGYKKALDALTKDINDELRALVGKKPVQGSSGPDLLKRQFPIGGRGGPGGAPSAFYFSRLQASFDGERWWFEGEVEAAERAPRWQAAVRLHALGEDGSKLAQIPIESIELLTESATAVMVEDGPLIETTGGITAVAFAGSSVPIGEVDGLRGELALEVTGRMFADA